MTTPHSGHELDGGGCRHDEDLPGTVTIGEHCLCGGASLVATIAVIGFLYPVLLDITQPLHLLSSTALVTVALAGWIGFWLGLEVVWEWRAGRLAVDA